MSIGKDWGAFMAAKEANDAAYAARAGEAEADRRPEPASVAPCAGCNDDHDAHSAPIEISPGAFMEVLREPAIRIRTPDKAAWLAKRRTGVTASEIGVLMGFAPETWNSPWRLFMTKTGQIPDEIPDSPRLRYGKHNEPFVVGEFIDRFPQFVAEGDGELLFAHPQRDWQMATPDRLIFDAGSQPDDEGLYPLAVLQVKTAGFAGEEWGEDGSDHIPLYVRAQVLWEMDVVGVQNGFVACWVGGSRLQVYEVVLGDLERQELALMRAAAVQFRLSIAAGEPPEVDWYPATTDALRALHPDLDDTAVEVPQRLAQRWRAAVRAEKAAKRRKRLYENRLREAMGSARRAVARGVYVPDRRGVMVPDVVARRDVYPVKEHVRKASVTDRLVAVGMAKEDADDG